MGQVKIMSWSSLDAATKDQMACTFAALFLHDEGIEVTAANLNKVLTATNCKVAGYWPMLFANALQGHSVGEFLAVSGGSAPTQVATTTGGGDAPAQVEEKKRRKRRGRRHGYWRSFRLSYINSFIVKSNRLEIFVLFN